jgi:hypothetical protein
MNTPMRPLPRHVPTLTEVIDLQEAQPAPTLGAEAAADHATLLAIEPAAVVEPLNLQDAPIPRAMLVDRGSESTNSSRTVPSGLPVASAGAPTAASLSPSPSASGLNEAALEVQISQRVMADLQRQIDGMLEYRLRETLAPILARTSEALVRELRQELSKTMKDVVARSVAQEMARQRSRA